MTRVTLWCHPGQARTPEPRVSARTPTQGRTASERDVRWCGPALWPSGVLSEQLRWEHEPGVAKKADGPCVWLGSLLHFRSALCSIPPCIPPVTNGGEWSIPRRSKFPDISRGSLPCSWNPSGLTSFSLLLCTSQPSPQTVSRSQTRARGTRPRPRCPSSWSRSPY